MALVRKIDSLGNHFTGGEVDENSILQDYQTLNQYSVATSGGILRFPNSTNFVFSGDFTIEAYLYMITNSGSESDVAGAWNTSGGARSWIFCDINPGNVGNKVSFFSISLDGSSGNTQGLTNAAYTFPTGQWVHVAVCRVDTTITAYVNGTVNVTGTMTGTNLNAGGQIGIGAYTLGGGQGTVFPGYISNFHIVNGTALYTKAFTAFINPIKAVTNTVLLTCQSSFNDNGPLNLSYTSSAASLSSTVPTFTGTILDYYSKTVSKQYRNGTLQTLGELDEYGMINNSYAVSFNGTSQYLTATNSAGWLPSSLGDWTIECWIYLTGYAANIAGNYVSYIASSQTPNNNTAGWQFGILGTASTWTDFYMNFCTSNVFTGVGVGAFPTLFDLNKWYHVAATKQGITISIFINGILKNSGPIAATNDGTTILRIGNLQHTGFPYYFPGYISNFRIVKGTALYTSNFVPPSAPLTNISGTTILTCQNSTIIDNGTSNTGGTGFVISNPASATTLLPSPNWNKTVSKQYSNGSLQTTGVVDEVTNGVFGNKPITYDFTSGNATTTFMGATLIGNVGGSGSGTAVGSGGSYSISQTGYVYWSVNRGGSTGTNGGGPGFGGNGGGGAGGSITDVGGLQAAVTDSGRTFNGTLGFGQGVRSAFSFRNDIPGFAGGGGGGYSAGSSADPVQGNGGANAGVVIKYIVWGVTYYEFIGYTSQDSGTFTTPIGTSYVKIWSIGKGGNGGFDGGLSNGGGGGAGAGVAYAEFDSSLL